MKKYEVNRLRNTAIIAHGKAGKTSLSEAMLFDGGSTDRLGRVDDGSSVMDFEPEEIKRKLTISSSFNHLEWDKHKINIIDTPGDANFIIETKNSLQSADAAVVVLDAVSGVEVQTEKVWEYANQFGLPRLIFISKMDRERADFFATLGDIQKVLSPKAIPLNLPIGAEESFSGVVDLLSGKAYQFENNLSGKFTTGDIPANLKDQAKTARDKLIEAIAESDDALLEKYLEGQELSSEDLANGLRKGVLNKTIFPVLCGSGLKNMGVQPFLDAIVQLLPSPLDRGPAKGTHPSTKAEEARNPKEEEPFSAFIFKTVADPYAGKLSIFRVWSGTLQADSTLYNANKGVRERFGQILQMEGKNQKPVESVGPGDIVAVAKLKETTTWETLCDEKKPIVYPTLSLPVPPVSMAVEPKSKGDEEKITTSLFRLCEEDPTVKLQRDEQTKELILFGMGQVHMEVTVEKLKRKFGVDVNLKTPKIPYKETIKSTKSGIIYRHKKQSGGRGQFAEVHFELSPLPRGAGFEFKNALVGMNVPRNFVPAVEKGVNEAMQSGVLAGYPVVDLKVKFYDGKSHEVDSSEIAFKIASSMALRKGVMETNPVLLEPIMNMEVFVPDEYMGDVIGDLNGRRGRVLSVEPRAKGQVIKSQVPLAEVLKYAPDLTSMTSGRGSFSMEFSHYEEVPAHLAEKVIAASKAEQKEA
ncbi:MAG TPA: elongation factor G [Thermodesulfobacteriota bacterium]|nr:elongation factor G [Thermodesulfobacteriota bacterium]